MCLWGGAFLKSHKSVMGGEWVRTTFNPVQIVAAFYFESFPKVLIKKAGVTGHWKAFIGKLDRRIKQQLPQTPGV